MSLHQIVAGLLNDYSYTTIIRTLNEITEEMFAHHSCNYNEMVQSRVEHFFTAAAAAEEPAPMSVVDLSTVDEEVATQMSQDVAMLGTKLIDIKTSKRQQEAPVPTVSVQKSEQPVPEPQPPQPKPKKLKKPVAKAKRV